MTLRLSPRLYRWTRAQQAIDQAGDPKRGKSVFRSVGLCVVNCCGWAADGKTGISWGAPAGANPRETKLDKPALIEAIKCGRPGTLPMPCHDRAAYRDDRCYGMVMSDFAPGSEATRGNTFGDNDVADVVTYLQTHVIGLGKPTCEECADFYDNRVARTYRSIK